MMLRFAVLGDELLLERFAAGQRAAADELFRRYQASAFGVAYRALGNDADAQDAVQEGFLKAVARLQAFQRRSSFKTWLLRIVYNAALELGRKRERRHRLLQRVHRQQKQGVLHVAADQRTLLQDILDREGEERAQALEDMIGGILVGVSLRMRVVIAKRRDGWSVRKIAETLGCCEGTVRADMDQFRNLLLSELAASGYLAR